MVKQMRVGVKAAWIIGLLAIAGIIIKEVFFKTKNEEVKSQTQKIKEQKVDMGAINYYNAGGDLKIENNTFKNTSARDTQNKPKKDEQKSQIQNQIINNAPNQGVQINENKGTVVLSKPLSRNFTMTDANKILAPYPTNFPIEIWLKGTNQESKRFFDQVVDAIYKLGYNNFTTNIVGLYASTNVIQNDFQYSIENGKLVISIFPQQ